MGKHVSAASMDWGAGIINSLEPDLVPRNAYIQGHNAALHNLSGDRAVVIKRKGCDTFNATPITGSTAIIGIHDFDINSGGTHYHLLVSDNGRFDRIDSAGTLTAIDATAFTSSSDQEHLPSFANANDLCFICNGTDKKKYNGTAVQAWGITKPASAPTLADSGAAGLHDGTYEARVTFYNSATGNESSAGPTSGTVTLTTNQISWTNIPVSADSQVTDRRLYLRNTSTMANFYRVATLSGNIATTTTTNVADSTLTEVGPNTSENDPPPTGIKSCAWHRARMFVCDDTNVYYSKVEKPEQFDPNAYEPINPDDGQEIVAVFSAFDVLIVFKSRSTWAIVGDDPATWEVQLIDKSVGCVARRSIVAVGGRIFWWSQFGPVMWVQGGEPNLLAPPLIANTVHPDVLNYAEDDQSKICGVADEQNTRIMWAVPDVGKERNTRILPFNYRVNRWESDKWDPMDVSALGFFDGISSRGYVILGGYSGQAFKWWSGENDGVASGTSSGTFVASSTSISAITDLTAAFDTTGGGLIERKVTVVNSEGKMVGQVRPYITANTATGLTLSSSISGLVDGSTYTYYIGGPAFDWESNYETFEATFIKKRMRFVNIQIRPGVSDIAFLVSAYIDFANVADHTITAPAGSALWDEFSWDEAAWDALVRLSERFRVARAGEALMVRIRQFAPDAPLTLLKVGFSAELLSEKLS